MNHLIITSLFFFLGALVSWLFFCWRMDRLDDILTDMLMNQYNENDRLNVEAIANTKLIFKLEEQACRYRMNQDRATECIKMLTQEILKYKQQEKENG